MVEHGSTELWLAAGLVILLWWAGTGVVLRLNRLPRQYYGTAMLGSSALALLGLWGIYSTTGQMGLGAHLISFCGMLAVWAWVEISYYLGYVTGLSNAPCPPGVSTRQRFMLALQASIYHELAVIGGFVSIALLTWQAPQQTALWCYLVLWLMRWSTKLNIFFGVSNINESWLPPALRYLSTFYEKRGMNLLFPLSVTIGTIALIVCVQSIPGAELSYQIGASFVATLLALGILEHWFLVIPLPNTQLWEPVFGTENTEQDTQGGDTAAQSAAAGSRTHTTLQHQPLAAGGST